jgi:hypothetical protein
MKKIFLLAPYFRTEAKAYRYAQARSACTKRDRYAYVVIPHDRYAAFRVARTESHR